MSNIQDYKVAGQLYFMNQDIANSSIYITASPEFLGWAAVSLPRLNSPAFAWNISFISMISCSAAVFAELDNQVKESNSNPDYRGEVVGGSL